jgi:hypothetical protein
MPQIGMDDDWTDVERACALSAARLRLLHLITHIVLFREWLMAGRKLEHGIVWLAILA